MPRSLIICCLLTTPLLAQDKAVQIGPDTRRLIPKGKEVDAIDGDFIIRNQHLTAVVAQTVRSRNANMTVKNVAGALIDLTENRSGSDQLSAFYPGRRAHQFSKHQLRSLSEGEETLNGVTVGTADQSVLVGYLLRNDGRGIRVRTVFWNNTDEPKTFKLEDDIRADGGKEYMGKNPNGDVDIVWIEDRFWGQAYGVISDHGKIRSNNNAKTSTLKYLVDGKSTKELKPGEKFELTRWIFPGRNLLDVRANIAKHRGNPYPAVHFALQDANGQPVPDAVVEIRNAASLGFARSDQRGRIETRLPPGKCTAHVTVNGEKLKPVELTPFPVGSSGGSIVVTNSLRLPDYKPGTIAASITAEDGSPIPCKVELQPHEGTPKPDFGPETAEFGVKNLIYTPNGQFERAVPSGKYDIIISRGPEYDAIFTELEVPEGGTAKLAGKLVRSVKTPGWISCDYHSHSSPSGDNTGSQLGRVLNFGAEHIEFAPCTEHNRVSSYEAHIASQNLGRFVATIPGMELTGGPLPLNHQNVFPMVHRPYMQDGGGPQVDNSPEKQMERLNAWDDNSRKLIQQNHPDIGWLFFDKNGDGKPDAGYERSFKHMDVVEIHAFGPTGPLTNLMEMNPYDVDGKGNPNRNNVVFNWLQLLNQGYRVMGITNTDAHYNFHGTGWVRNWIKSSTDEPADIDMEEMLANSEAGRLVMSNGPYLEVSVVPQSGSNVQTVSGGNMTVRNGKLNAHVRVQCANWLDIDRVFVLVNGRPTDDLTFTREKNPNMFSDGVVKFDQQIEIELEDDAHIIFCTAHKTKSLGPVVGPNAKNHKPAALTNPIFVNVKGDEFVANKDTLGHPLPVKKQD